MPAFTERVLYMPSKKSVIFVSHAQRDAQAAEKLQEWLSSRFSENAEVFVSSYWGSIEPGQEWYREIMTAIEKCKLGIVLVTKNSLNRPWVTYEVGALQLLKKKPIPLCIGSIRKSELPAPLNVNKALEYGDAADRLTLLRSIARSLNLPHAWIKEAEDAPDLAKLVIEPEPVVSPPLSPLLLSSEYVEPNGRLLAKVYDTADRWTTVVYTCRAVFSGEVCPTDTTPALKKTVSSHIPVDEIRTVCMAMHWLLPLDSRQHEDDVRQNLLCSKQAGDFLNVDSANHTSSSAPPGLRDRDWIIIGENNFSNPLLHLMRAYLPWHNHVGSLRPEQGTIERPHVYVEMAARFGDHIPPRQKREIGKGGGMITIFPNPYNIQKKVLVLFGCHREGQFTLEHWFRSDNMVEVFSALAKHLEMSGQHQAAIQVIVEGVPKDPLSIKGWAGPCETNAIPNCTTEENRPFWVTPLSSHKLDNLFQINSWCADAEDLYDLSLIGKIDTTIQEELYREILDKVPAPDLYWENQVNAIGFHFTLYEFCAHIRPTADLIARLNGVGGEILESLLRSEKIPT